MVTLHASFFLFYFIFLTILFKRTVYLVSEHSHMGQQKSLIFLILVFKLWVSVAVVNTFNFWLVMHCVIRV